MSSDTGKLLVGAYPGLVKLAAKILDNPWYAEDIVQDAVLATLEASDIEDPVRYCYRAVRNRSYSLLCSRKYTPDLPEQQMILDPEHEQLLAEVSRISKSLSETLTTILELRYEQGMSCQAIAQICGLSHSTVTRKIREAHQEIRKSLEE